MDRDWPQSVTCHHHRTRTAMKKKGEKSKKKGKIKKNSFLYYFLSKIRFSLPRSVDDFAPAPHHGGAA